MNFRRFLPILTMIFCFAFLSAQPPLFQFKQIGVSHGLSHSSVNRIYKDSDGFMWFATASGLNRYDGYSFKIFQHNPENLFSLPDNYVDDIQADVENRLWIHTAAGYIVYDVKREKFINSAVLLREYGVDHAINFIFIDKDKNILCYVNSVGFYRYDPNTKKTDFFGQTGQAKALSRGIITDIKECDGGYVVVFQSGLVECINKASWQVDFKSDHVMRKQKENPLRYSVFVDSDNDFWIYSDLPFGMWVYSPGNNEWKHLGTKKSDYPYRLSSDIIQDIVQHPNGLVWLGTDHGGIDIINKKSNTLTNLQNRPFDERSIAHNSINCIYVDDKNIVWVGTYKDGISFYGESTYKFNVEHLADFYHLPNFKPDVNSITKDSGGNYWIGTNGNGLIRQDKKKGGSRIYQSSNSALANDVVVSLCAARDGNIWIGTYQSGMNRFDGRQFKHYAHIPGDANSLANDNVWSITEDQWGMIWIGTLGGGLQKLDPKTGRFTSFENSRLSSPYISSLFIGKGETLIIGTAIGITLYDMKSGEFEILHGNRRADQLFTNLNVNQVYEDSRGLIWIGTREGLNVWDRKSDNLSRFYSFNGLANDVIAGIVEDDQRNMWITTSNGVSCIVVNGNPKIDGYSFSFVNYSELDGLQGYEFNLRSVHRSPDGGLLLGGTNGFNFFNPADIKYNTSLSKVSFTGLKLFNSDILVDSIYGGNKILSSGLNDSKEIVFSYRQNMFSVEFSSMDYVLPEKAKYAYMLKGFNTDWIVTDALTHGVTYTNLAPGKYELRVKAANSDGFWSEEWASLNIRIKPPFWLSPIAYLFYFLLLITILLIARYMIIRNERQKYQLKQVEFDAQRKHEIDEMKLRFFTNISHELRTPLTLIISPLENIIKAKPDDDQKYKLSLIHKNAVNLLHIINQLLDFRKSENKGHTLNLSYGDIVSSLKHTFDYFGEYAHKKNIRLSFFPAVKEYFMAFDEDKMGKIMMNLLSNAIKFTEQNGTVDVLIKPIVVDDQSQLEQLEIKVIDTGIGIKDEDKNQIFERFYQSEAKKGESSGSGIGLHIVREFVSLCKGTIRVYDNNPKGSVFALNIPVGKLPNVTKPLPENMPPKEVAPEIEEADYYLDEPGEEEVAPTNEIRVLVVDYNDDFRFFMRDSLKDQFQVLDAANGKEAWQKIMRYMPDIIVSDIMMPEMDGYELGEKVKTDVRTSHIPLILLTAHMAEENQIKGLKMGADDYITKPFNFDVLLLRINKMLELRRRRQEVFRRKIEIEPSEITITPLDEKLIENAIKLVEDNISQSDFSVERLSQELGISRVHLYKKLVSVTGKSPIEFIRVIRLKRAAQLLVNSQMNVSEIAYQVGHNNPKTFSKYFKDEFGVLPSNYQDFVNGRS